MNEHSEKLKKEIETEVLTRCHRTQKYNNQTEKYKTGVQQ